MSTAVSGVSKYDEMLISVSSLPALEIIRQRREGWLGHRLDITFLLPVTVTHSSMTPYIIPLTEG